VTELPQKARRDRDHLGDEGYEVEVLAKLTGLSRYQVFKLIEKYGRDRENLVREAELLRDVRTGDEDLCPKTTVEEGTRQVAAGCGTGHQSR
jgi:hypothetical protein